MWSVPPRYALQLRTSRRFENWLCYFADPYRERRLREVGEIARSAESIKLLTCRSRNRCRCADFVARTCRTVRGHERNPLASLMMRLPDARNVAYPSTWNASGTEGGYLSAVSTCLPSVSK